MLIISVRDGHYLKLELFIVLTSFFVPAVFFMMKYFVPGVNQTDLDLPFCVSYLFSHVITIFLPMVYAIYWRNKSRKVLLKSDYQTFQDMLQDPVLLKKFEAHVAKDLCFENCLFYREVRLR